MDPRLSVVNKRLENVKRIIAVSGGEGGTGKSLTASVLALSLCKRGYSVGLLDLDFCDPSVHEILGVKGVFPEGYEEIVPLEINNLKFMSIVYFIGNSPASLRRMYVSSAIIEVLTITRWGKLDFLIIDIPSGLGDSALDFIRLVERVEFLFVTTASRVALDAMKKELQVLRQFGTPVIGVLENMRNGENSVEDEIAACRVPFLGSIGFDQKVEGALGDMSELLKTSFAKTLEENLLKSRTFLK